MRVLEIIMLCPKEIALYLPEKEIVNYLITESQSQGKESCTLS